MFVHRNLWRYVEGGGESKYCVSGEFLSTDVWALSEVALHRVFPVRTVAVLNESVASEQHKQTGYSELKSYPSTGLDRP